MTLIASIRMPLLALAGLVAASTALAQNLKPGLWEMSSKAQGGQMEQAMTEMQQQMAAMPPEQRKMMEEMMAKQGVRIAPGGGGAFAVQVCLTKDMVERNQLPVQQGDCKTTQQQRSGNTMKLAFTCTNPASSGEGELTFVSAEAYRSRMNIKTNVNGRPEAVTMDGSGRFLGADCGSVRPVQAPPR